MESPASSIAKGFTEALFACGVSALQLAHVRSIVTAQFGEEGAGSLGPLALQAYASALVEVTGEAGLGMRVAAAVPTGATGVVEYILLTAPTLRAVHHLHAQFALLTADFLRFSVYDDEGLTRIALLPPQGLVLAPLLEDYRMARIVFGIRRATIQARFTPARVAFTYPRPSSIAQHEATFGRGVTFRFGQARAEVAIPSVVSDQPLPTSDPALHAILLDVGRQMLSKSTQSVAVAAQVRHLLIAALHEGRPPIGSVCKRLGMSERTLRRRLADEGTSFAALLDQVRAALAQVLVLGADASEKNLTHKLGFESTSALRKARKRWARSVPVSLSQQLGSAAND